MCLRFLSCMKMLHRHTSNHLLPDFGLMESLVTAEFQLNIVVGEPLIQMFIIRRYVDVDLKKSLLTYITKLLFL